MRQGMPRLLLVVLCLGGARAAAPAEISAFVSGGRPDDKWTAGYGGMLTITLLNLVHGEVEGGHQGSEEPGIGLLTLAAKAYVGPSIGRLVPYAGLGAGVFLALRPRDDDWGTSGLVFVGAKVKLPLGLVVRGEYQLIDMPETALVDLDQRYLVAAGLSF